MKKFIDINDLNNIVVRLQNDKINKVNTIIDKLTFIHIFILWMLIIISFGFVYYFFRDSGSYLFSTIDKEPVTHFLNHIYYSFITATTTGFGDIVPLGMFKAVSIVEVVFGLVLLALVTSKFISIKQDSILTELYEISFKDRITKIRSSLLLFRQNIGKIIHGMEEITIRKQNIDDIYVYISSFDDVLQEIYALMDRSGNVHFTKSLDAMNVELIFNSVILSFQKLHELLLVLNQKNVDWKRDVTLAVIKKCLLFAQELFKVLKITPHIPGKVRKHILLEWETLNQEISKELDKKRFS